MLEAEERGGEISHSVLDLVFSTSQVPCCPLICRLLSNQAENQV